MVRTRSTPTPSRHLATIRAEIAYVIGDVKDKTAVIVDDIIDTAGTLRAAGETVKDEGARRVFACAT
ncbi:MAG TPA: phosphoribosyltransferase family protein, partial [Solirubrobacterales bacterium]|nr:phosphoribosyltransferase family protein [Solirubrobacterales bacterium]